MPRNRQRVPKEERSAELLAAATELFLAHGYAGPTTADISAAAGVARGTVYWYFKSKDDIFAAVMDRMLGRETDALNRELRGKDPLTALTGGLADMRPYRSLHRSMHERIEHSVAVHEAHKRSLDWVRAMVYEVLDRHPHSVDREMIADLTISLFEGANVPQTPRRPSHEMIRFLLESRSRRHR
ncbi:TetR/AcrR family transcriptional regulator [Nocardia amamiensis]|uniref:TetR/AcrR family transcriptional regulator n=1 Tax=Nocardia TaxID=1817 RepID=UPI0033DE9ADA